MNVEGVFRFAYVDEYWRGRKAMTGQRLEDCNKAIAYSTAALARSASEGTVDIFSRVLCV